MITQMGNIKIEIQRRKIKNMNISTYFKDFALY